jgi:hypothetical protein
MTTQPQLECCPPFTPDAWHDQITSWHNKPFIKDHVFTFLYIPLTFGKVMKRLDQKVRAAGAQMPDWLCLADHTSKWNMDVYLAVDKQIPHAENTTLTGKFYSRVYEGPFKDTRKWCDDFQAAAKAKNLTIKKLFMWYTTCPKCAKKYGKNYVAVLAQVE